MIRIINNGRIILLILVSAIKKPLHQKKNSKKGIVELHLLNE